MADSTYSTTPRSQRSQKKDDVHFTPKSDIGQDRSCLSERGKARVDAAAPNGSRCMITNVPNIRSTQYAHIYPRRIMKDKMELLEVIEFNWGLGENTLNLDTRRNVVRLDSSLHILHDNPEKLGCWMLLPSQTLINSYHAAIMEEVDTDAPFKMPDKYQTGKRLVRNESYMYRLVPLNMEMELGCIPVHADLVDGRKPTADDISLYFFPFEDLPPIKSHLNPRFAILEAGRRFQELSLGINSLNFIGRYLDQETFDKIVDIYYAWTTRREDKDAKDRANKMQEDEEEEDNDSDQGPGDSDSKSAYTSEGTGKRSTRSKRKHPGTPSRQGGSKSSQRRRLNSGPRDQDCNCSASCLSGETLHEHESASGKRAWGEGEIHNWAKTVVEAVPVADYVSLNIEQL